MRTGRHILGLTASVTTSLAAANAGAKDVVVWQATPDGYRTTWLDVTDARTETLGVRVGMVQSDGKDLWLITTGTVPIKVLPCEDLDGGGTDQDEPGAGGADADDTSTPAEEGEYDWPVLTQRSLLSSKERTILGPADGDPFMGEVWNNVVSIVGGAGGLLMVDHINSGYACGAHGYDDSAMFVADLGGDQTVPAGKLVENLEQYEKAPVKALSKRVMAEECADDADMLAEDIDLEGISLYASGGKLKGTATFVYPTGAEWNFACTISYESPLVDADMAAPLRPSAEVKQALKALSASGVVGYSDVSLSGDARAAAIKAFLALPEAPAPVPTRAAPDAAPYIERGRQLTAKKQYVRAVKAFDAAIRKDPKAARAWSGRGYARLLAGQLDLAARDLDHALTLDESSDYHAAVLFNLGQVLEKKGDPQQARRAYTKSLALRASKPVQKALDALKAK